jgi:site-specific recombinase XerD
MRRAKGWENPNKGKRFPPEPLTKDEITALINRCSNRAPTGIRNRALLVILWRGQLRISEALALKVKDIDQNKGTVRVLHGKGDKSRLIGLDAQAMAFISRWIDLRRALGLSGRTVLFCTLQGKPIKTAYIRQWLPRIGQKAGIEKRVAAHQLRHTGAFELANESVPLHVIQAQLGHASLAVTDRYVRHLNPKAVVQAMQARSW